MAGIIPRAPGPIPQAPPGSGVSNTLARLAHWIIQGNAPGAGLNAVPGQLAHMFNPAHPQGLAQLAMLFAGGPKGSPVENASWLEPYNMPKAMSGGHVTFREGQPWDVHNDITMVNRRGGQSLGNPNDPAFRQELYKQLHDALFGGTVHMTPGNNIPPRP